MYIPSYICGWLRQLVRSERISAEREQFSIPPSSVLYTRNCFIFALPLLSVLKTASQSRIPNRSTPLFLQKRPVHTPEREREREVSRDISSVSSSSSSPYHRPSNPSLSSFILFFCLVLFFASHAEAAKLANACTAASPAAAGGGGGGGGGEARGQSKGGKASAKTPEKEGADGSSNAVLDASLLGVTVKKNENFSEWYTQVRR